MNVGVVVLDGTRALPVRPPGPAKPAALDIGLFAALLVHALGLAALFTHLNLDLALIGVLVGRDRSGGRRNPRDGDAPHDEEACGHGRG
jgi:hypothetical protein